MRRRNSSSPPERSSLPLPSRNSTTLILVLLLSCWAASIPLACLFGPAPVNPVDALRALLAAIHLGPQDGLDDTAMLVVAEIRLARALLALLVGGGLALAGVAMQGVLRNPLAEPFVLGVSSGAALGAATVLAFGGGLAAGRWGTTEGAMAGAVLALGTALLLGGEGSLLRGRHPSPSDGEQTGRERLILAGVAVSTMFGAGVSLIKAVDEESVTGIVFWIMGSFQGRGWTDVPMVLLPTLLGLALLLPCWRALDMLAAGDADAEHLGVRVRAVRLAALLGAGCLTAGCVAVAGIIGFVGLVAPHILRRLLGPWHGPLYAAAWLGGGLFLLWADVAARSLLPQGLELPVGVLTSLVGGPFFAVVLRGRRRSSRISSEERRVPSGQTTKPARPVQARRESCLVCRKLEAGYGHTPVLKDINLTLRGGEITAVIGPNGSGKSTLLRCLSGVLPAQASVPPSSPAHPLTGTSAARREENQSGLFLDDRPLHDLTPRQRARRIAVLPQRPEAPAGIHAGELVLLGRYPHLALHGLFSRADRQAAQEAMQILHVDELAKRPMDHLSGGERQRVFLARALAQGADILLLDEPTSAMDPARSADLFSTLGLLTDAGTCVVAVVHDINAASLYARRIVGLKNGRVLFDGPATDLTTVMLEKLYDVPFVSLPHPLTGAPLFLPAKKTPARPPANKSGKKRGTRGLFCLLAATLSLTGMAFSIPDRSFAAASPILATEAPTQAAPEISERPTPPSDPIIRLTDDTGHHLELPGPAHRVVALYGAFNDIMLDMGLGDLLVGRTRADTRPELEHLPVIGTHMRPSDERIVALHPDVVLQFEGRREAEALADRLRALGVRVAVFRGSSFADLFRMIRALGTLTGENEKADALEADLRRRLDAVTLARQGKRRPRVLYEIRSPNLLAAGRGSMASAIVEAAGGENVVVLPDRVARLNEEELIHLAPDVYLVQQGPMNPSPTPLDKRPHYRTLDAVRRGRILTVDETLFSRPAPGAVTAVEQLAALFHTLEEQP